MTSRQKDQWFKETVKTVIYAVVIAIVIRTFLFEPFNIPSGSMLPTLYVGDYLFVSKYAYGYSRYSLPYGMPLIEGRALDQQPERGDVAVFKLPRDNATDYIKRVIGLPGDRIQVKQGVLHINGQAVERAAAGIFRHHNSQGNMVIMRRYLETLPNGSSHYIVEQSDNGSLDETAEYLVPEGHVFCMGDNRDNSLDSRVMNGPNGVGFVPLENLVGRAEMIFFSTNGRARLWEIWKWPVTIRYDRLFQSING